jgi:UDP-glucose 4-epimerase
MVSEMVPTPVLVTGAAGYIGRNLVHRLADRGHPVTAVDILASPNSRYGRAQLDRPGVVFQQCDVTDPAQIGPLVASHPIVAHLASIVGVQAVIEQPRAVLDQLFGVAAIADALTPDHVLLLASSSDVYGLHSVLHHDAPMREDDLTVLEPPHVPRWSYAHMKALAESVFAGSVARAVGVRIFNCYGPGLDYPQPRRVIPTFATRILAGEPIELSGDGSQRRAYCHVDDIVSGMVAALDHIAAAPAGAYEAINLGDPTGTLSILDLARRMNRLAVEHGVAAREVEIQAHRKRYSAGFNDQWHRTVDIGKAARLLGYAPKVTLDDGLQQVMEFYRDVAREPR